MKKRVGIIVQARVGSSRLPYKMIYNLCGREVIFRIIERLTRVKEIDELILAIPKTKNDQIFRKIKFPEKVKIFCGSENNLVERYYKAAKKHNIQTIVRIPGDNCMPEPREIERIVEFYKKKKKKCFVTNLSQIFNNGYPDGIGAEVFDVKFLKDILRNKMISKQKLEHIHLNFVNYKKSYAVNPHWCEVYTIKCPKRISYPAIKLDINTLKDYKYIKKIYDSLYRKNKNFKINDIINFLKNNN